MKSLFDRAVRLLSSLGTSCVLLTLLALLTWLGTLEQVDSGLFDVQRRYFDSLFLIHRAGGVPIPLPGARLVMGLLFVNLILGGVVRMRRTRATAGILIAHLGIAFLLVAGMVKSVFAREGHVTLYEGQSASTFESYYRWEIAVLEDLGEGRVREVLAREERFLDATGSSPVRIASVELPFALEVSSFQPNCRVQPRSAPAGAANPVIDGFALERLPLRAEAESNVAGAYAAVVDPAAGTRQEGILWGAAEHPLTATVSGRRFGIELRRERFTMPFAVRLDDFVKEDHPRLDMPKSFSSDVTIARGPSTRPVKISMNEPLREGGLVLYQASWGPANAAPGEPLFSTLAVVKNPADQFPLYACILIAIGLSLHFARKLARHIRSEAVAA